MQTVYHILPVTELQEVTTILTSCTIGEFTTEKYHIKVRQTNKLDGEYRLLQVLAEFQGKYIPELYAFFKYEKFDCLVTQLITGTPISESPHAKLPELFLQYAKILNEIHTKTGVIHCDIKPDHLIITANGLVILDFDLAYLPPNDIKSSGFYHYLQYPNVYHLGEYRGSPRYSSINVHLGLAPSPSWDYESLYYSFLSLCKPLPWSGASNSDPQIRFINKLSFVLTERHHLYNLVVESQRKDSFYFLELFNILVTEYVTPATHRGAYNKTSIQEHKTHVAPSVKVLTGFSSFTNDSSLLKAFSFKNDDISATYIERRPEQAIKTSASLFNAEQTSNNKTSIEQQVRNIIGQLLVTHIQEYDLVVTSSYYSKFRAGSESQIDLYGTDISTINLSALFNNDHINCKYHKININFHEKLNIKVSDKGTILGEVFCFPKEEDAEFSKLFLKKCAQLEADLLRFQCKINPTPHPLEILDSNIWACVATGAYQSIFNWKREKSFNGLQKLEREEKRFPRIFLLSLVDKFNLFIIHDATIQNAIDERSWHSSSISDQKEQIPTLGVYLLLKTGLSPSSYPIHNSHYTVKESISELLQKNLNAYPPAISILVANSGTLPPDPAKATPIDALWLEQSVARFAEGQVLVITLADYRQDERLIWQKGSSGFEMKTKALNF